METTLAGLVGRIGIDSGAGAEPEGGWQQLGNEEKAFIVCEVLKVFRGGDFVLTPDICRTIKKRLKANCFRNERIEESHASCITEFDSDDVDAVPHDPRWVYLRPLYETFLRMVVSQLFTIPMAREILTNRFLARLIGQLSIPYQDERECVKVLLHKIYKRFVYLRRQLKEYLLSFLASFHIEHDVFCLHQLGFDQARDNYGAAEALKILESIVAGYSVPLEEKHIAELVRVVLPLHKLDSLDMLCGQLIQCQMAFIDKDIRLADLVIRDLIDWLPQSNTSKALLMLNELCELVHFVMQAGGCRAVDEFILFLASCIWNENSHIAELAIETLLEDEYIAYVQENVDIVLQIQANAEKAQREHWDESIASMANFLLVQLARTAPSNIVEKSAEHLSAQIERECLIKSYDAFWASLEKLTGTEAPKVIEAPVSHRPSLSYCSVACPEASSRPR